LQRKVAGTALPIFDAPGWVARIDVLLPAIGFISALVVAWGFERTPKGWKRDAEVPEESIAPQTAQRMDRTIIIVRVWSLGYFAVDEFVPDAARDASSDPAAVGASGTGAATADTSTVFLAGPPLKPRPRSRVVLGVAVVLQVANGNADRPERIIGRETLIRLHAHIEESIAGQDRDLRFLERQLANQKVVGAALDAGSVAPADETAFQRRIATPGNANPPRLFRRTIDEIAAVPSCR